jgi:hypothetical protein
MNRRMKSGPVRVPLGCYEHAMKKGSFLPFSRAHASCWKGKDIYIHNISTFTKCKAIAPNKYKMQSYSPPAPLPTPFPYIQTLGVEP